MFSLRAFFFIASFDHLCVKIIPLDHFYANFDGMTLDLEYWQEKISFITDFLKWLENEEKTMICSFFKFSVLKHFWSLKLIDRVDFRVLLMFYSFQVIWVDLNDEFEKWTKYSKKLINTEISRHLIWWYFCLFFLMIDCKDTPTCLHTMYAENQTKCKINIGNKYSQTKWLSG